MESLRSVLKWMVRVGLASVVVKILYQRYAWIRKWNKLKELGWPVNHRSAKYAWLGGLPEGLMNFNHIYDYKLSLFERYGNTYGALNPIWNEDPMLNTREPLVVKHILKDNYENYIKGEKLILMLNDLLGEGIFAVNHGPHAKDQGKNWYFQRKTASKIFTRNKFNNHVHATFVNNTAKLVSRLDQVASNKDTIDMQSQFYSFTLDTIGDIGFGVDLDTLSSATPVDFAHAFDQAQKMMRFRPISPMFQYPIGKLLYWRERELGKHLKTLNKFCDGIIRDRLTADGANNGRGDILSLFIEADPNRSTKFFRDIIMSFMIAGRDTSASLLSFTFLLLVKHQDAQAKLYSEISKHQFGDGKQVTMEQLSELEYLNGVVQETLRLFPPVPLDTQQAVEDDVLSDGRRIPAGTKVTFDNYSMGRSDDLWDNPLEFRPERWIGPDRASPDQYSAPIFKAGPRICLGKDLAQFEAKFLTYELIKRYKFTAAKPLPEPPYCPGITLTVNGGLHLCIEQR